MAWHDLAVKRWFLPVILAASACSEPAAQSTAPGLAGDAQKIAAAILSHEATLPRERNPTCLALRTEGVALDGHRRSLESLRTERPPNPAEEPLRIQSIEYHSNPLSSWRRPGTSVAYNWEAGVPLPKTEAARLDGAVSSIIRAKAQPAHLAAIEPGAVPWSLRRWGRWGICTSELLLSAPAFHDDLAFVETSYGCGGLCGYGWLYALRREGADWKIVATALTWVS
jgi:hypothetical protein